MSISGKQTINIGLPNESANSDSLYTAFTKAQNNFDVLFACASPYSTFTAGNGISVNANSSTGSVVITNSGVTNIIAGTNIVVSSANGNVTISSTGGGNGGGGTVTSVGVTPVSTDRLTTTGSPVVSSGNINIDLAVIANVTPASYTNPNVTIDAYGRVIAVSNGASAGSVTSVGLTPGAGIQINGGPITTAGAITVTNIGVTRLTAGTGIAVSGANGNVTISATASGGTVTAVGVSSSQLVVSGSPVVNSGTIVIDLPASATFSGSLSVTGNATVGNVTTTGNITITGTTGRMGIGTATPDAELNILASPQTVSYSLSGNSTTSGTDLHISGADGSNTRITQDAFGTGSYVAFTGRTARGTAATPTQTQSGDILTQLTGRGFSNGSLQFGNVSTGRVDVIAAENFTDASRATNVVIYTTSAGNINSTAIATFTGSGANIIGTANISGNANVGNLGTEQVLATANVTAPQLISNIATGTAPFVVNSTTQVANLNVATAGTVITNAQPNITSVGTLTSLVVTGNANVGNLDFGAGTITGTGNVNIGNLNTTSSLTANTIFLPSSQILASGAAVNLAVTASYFTTTGASTATLAAGTAGLIKTFMMVDNTGGAMVITVTNAGWKATGTGTITFNAFGAGCILQYINSKWYAIGINGVVFG